MKIVLSIILLVVLIPLQAFADNSGFYGTYDVSFSVGPCSPEYHLITIGNDENKIGVDDDYLYIPQTGNISEYSGVDEDQDNYDMTIYISENTLNLFVFGQLKDNPNMWWETQLALTFTNDYNEVAISGSEYDSDTTYECQGQVTGSGFKINTGPENDQLSTPAINGADSWGAFTDNYMSETGPSLYLGHDILIKDQDGIIAQPPSHTVTVLYPDEVTQKKLAINGTQDGNSAYYWLSDFAGPFQSGVYSYTVTDSAGNFSTFTDTITVKELPIVDMNSILVQTDLTTPTINWTPVTSPDITLYRARINNMEGSTVWQGYTKYGAYTVPPGILDPNTQYKVRIEALGGHQWFEQDSRSTSPYVYFSTGNEALDPFVSLEADLGVSAWTDNLSGNFLNFRIEVFDSQKVPENIASAKVIFPDGETQLPLYFDYSKTDKRGVYRSTYFADTFPSGDFTFVVTDKNNKSHTVVESFSPAFIGNFVESSLLPVHYTVTGEGQIVFSWDPVTNTASYQLEILDQNDNRLNAIQVENSANPQSQIFSGFFKKQTLYKYRVLAWPDYFENNPAAGSSSTWNIFSPQFMTDAVTNGSSVPTIDTDHVGVALAQVGHPDNADTYYMLEFSVLANDPDGVPGSIKSVQVQYPADGVIKDLYFDHSSESGGAYYYLMELLDDPSQVLPGIYTFKVEDQDGNIAEIQDELIPSIISIPENSSPVQDDVVPAEHTISWDPVDEAQKYRVRIYQNLDEQVFKSEFTSATSITIPEGFEIGIYFGYRIYAYKENPEIDVDNYSVNMYSYSQMPHYMVAESVPIISAVPSMGDAPVEVTFSVKNISTEDIVAFEWDFNGDGTIDLTQAPPVIHFYETPGVYEAVLTLTPKSGEKYSLYTKVQVNEPPANIPTANVIQGGDVLKTEYVLPVSDQFEITYVVAPKEGVDKVVVDYPSFTYNVVTSVETTTKVVMDVRRIDWAYAETSNSLKTDFLTKALTKPVPKPISSADTFNDNGKQISSASLVINLKTLTKDITVALTPYKNPYQVPASETLESQGYILLAGADVSVMDSSGNKIYWNELKQYCTLEAKIAVKTGLINTIKQTVDSNDLHLFVFDNATDSWTKKTDAVIIEDQGLFRSTSNAVSSLAPFIVAYLPSQESYTKTGILKGKLSDLTNSPLKDIMVTLVNQDGIPVTKAVQTDSDGLFSIDFKLTSDVPETFMLQSFGSGPVVYNKCTSEGISMTVSPGWNFIGLKTSHTNFINALVAGSKDKIMSLWKWQDNTWAVSLPKDGPASTIEYAQSKGFVTLGAIRSGEGFWVNSGAGATLDIGYSVDIDTGLSQLINLVDDDCLAQAKAGLLFSSGWNAFALKGSAAISPAALVSDYLKVTMDSIWKWENGGWAVYLPQIADQGAAYAKGKGFQLLETINPGEGFWVNGKVDEAAVFIEQESVPIPGGTFLMGNQSGIGIDNEKPVHQVTLSSFKIYKHEVTNEAYALFIKDGGYVNKSFWVITEDGLVDDPDVGWKYSQSKGWAAPDTWNLADEPYWKNAEQSNGADMPVSGISWYEAYAYCKWLSAKTGKTYRLPTESEWEYAARGGLAGKKYPWGDSEPDGTYCNYGLAGDGYENAAPVGSYPANGYGLYDMAGNVYEWCLDWYADYNASPANDPGGPLSGTERIVRGSSFVQDTSNSIRCSFRGNVGPGFRYDNIGLRCVQE